MKWSFVLNLFLLAKPDGGKDWLILPKKLAQVRGTSWETIDELVVLLGWVLIEQVLDVLMAERSKQEVIFSFV